MNRFIVEYLVEGVFFLTILYVLTEERIHFWVIVPLIFFITPVISAAAMTKIYEDRSNTWAYCLGRIYWPNLIYFVLFLLDSLVVFIMERLRIKEC